MLITNIQRFSLHDGPGIRTTVFLKGCNLRCPWCANPENLSFEKERYNKDGLQGIYGYEISIEELEKEILKDALYYENGGGVTFSGGEALLHFKELEPLLKRLKNRKIHICIETALMVKKELVEIALKYVDLFIIDIKILDNTQCNNIIGGNIQTYKDNIDRVFESNKKVIFRIPLIKPYTYNEQNIERISEFLTKYNPEKVEIFKVHQLAENKYKSLNKKMLEIKEKITDQEIEELKNKLNKLHINTEICQL